MNPNLYRCGKVCISILNTCVNNGHHAINKINIIIIINNI